MKKLASFLTFLLLIEHCTSSTLFKRQQPQAHTTNKDTDYKIVCYYTNWAQYRNDPAKFFPEDIDPTLCTHIIFSFAKIDENLELSSFEWNDESTEFSQGMYHKTVELKSINKDLKVLIAVGGWNHGSKPFSDMARAKRSRFNFVDKAIMFLKKHRFDGLDLDWEYPASRDTANRPEDQYYFTELCKDLYTAFESHGLILSAAVAAGYKTLEGSYEMDEIHKHLDFINLMTYDLRGSWDNVTGHNAPLYTNKYDVNPKLTVDYAVQLWLDHVPPEKLVLGIASYGRSFKLHDGFESCPLTNTPVSGAAKKGEYSREDGFLTYFEVCNKILESGWRYAWNEVQQVPYAYSNESSIQSGESFEWVGFDDVKSVEIKVKYAMKHKLGGAMIWAMDMDDFSGEFCNQGKYPILTTINHYMNPELKLNVPVYQMTRPTAADFKRSDRNHEFKPTLESDFIKPASKEIDTLSSDLLTTTNAFSLMNNDPLQVYKFCQCKNGTHHLKATFEEDFFYKVDCNRKQVVLTSGLMEKERPEDLVDDIIEFREEENTQFPSSQSKDSGFFLFSFNNSATRLYAVSTPLFLIVCSLVILFMSASD